MTASANQESQLHQGDFPVGTVRHAVNPKASVDHPYGEDERSIMSRSAFTRAMAEIGSWPGYHATPLRSLTGLAGQLGLFALWYKDESTRFGLGSFKALGGAYAVLCHLRREIARTGCDTPDASDMMAGRHADVTGKITVTTATDGNHGRSVAWGAQLFGCNCVIYIPAACSEGREAAIASYGAQVVRVDGLYDDAVKQAARDATANGWTVISDTTWPGYTEIPRDVMQGYGVMVDEALAALPAGQLPTHVFVQGGVGALPAAVAAHLWEALGPRRPRLITVEPHRADCLYLSALAGQASASEGDLDTVMAGLACGETSVIAWSILKLAGDDFITISDDAAISAMRLLAAGVGGDEPVVGGESGVAGLAGLLAVLRDKGLAERLGLGADSRVLLFGTEGATDPVIYERLVGRRP